MRWFFRLAVVTTLILAPLIFSRRAVAQNVPVFGEFDSMQAVIEGGEIDPAEAATLEQTVEADPGNVKARSKLLGYYLTAQHRDPAAAERRKVHVLWMIENQSDSEVAGTPYCGIDQFTEPSAFDQGKKLWLKQVEHSPANTKILGNAANFFTLYDNKIAFDLLNRAKKADPENPHWPEQLGHLFELVDARTDADKKTAAVSALAEYEAALKLTIDPLRHFYLLDSLAKSAFDAGDFEKAKTFATESIKSAADNDKDWNYGNAIHHGNLILGRIALQNGDVESAKASLLAAGKTPGSPQLTSFGPSMMLAKLLLDRGEKDVVLEYITLCSSFWKMGGHQLAEWTKTINDGGKPTFGANLDY